MLRRYGRHAEDTSPGGHREVEKCRPNYVSTDDEITPSVDTNARHDPCATSLESICDHKFTVSLTRRRTGNTLQLTNKSKVSSALAACRSRTHCWIYRNHRRSYSRPPRLTDRPESTAGTDPGDPAGALVTRSKYFNAYGLLGAFAASSTAILWILPVRGLRVYCCGGCATANRKLWTSALTEARSADVRSIDRGWHSSLRPPCSNERGSLALALISPALCNILLQIHLNARPGIDRNVDTRLLCQNVRYSRWNLC